MTYHFIRKTTISKYSIVYMLVFIISCNHPSTVINPTKDTLPSKQKQTKPPASFSDTLSIEGDAAVFFMPDSLQKIKMEQQTSGTILQATEHECIYLMRNARKVLHQYWPGIRIYDAVNVRYIRYVNSSEHKYADLNQENDFCGLLLFSKNKKPLLADMANIDTQLHFFFDNPAN